ncbi:MAG TPA: Xaa-Pro peptidase family protein [Gaiellaceae bacterium]|jgi:Xaa-Pro aminopeptidase|nr:Xaa-Pro peptidase family protein [Gaiellaceae bacterium]
MNGRIERLRQEMDDASAASFLISNPINVRYLTGFESSNAFVLVQHEQVVLLTDGRYIEAARAVEGVEARLVDREFAPGVATELPALAEPPVAFEADHLTYSRHQILAAAGVELVPTSAIVHRLRAVKEPAELEEIRRSAAILHDVYGRLAGESLVGRTEQDVAWWFELALHDEGAHGIAFDVTVASGPNAALPHHHTGDRMIGTGETVVVDAGAKVDGYCSDCTRTFATGPLPDELRRAYATCRSAQERALAEVGAGAGARDLDRLARGEIEDGGFEVLHGLGHGVGLEVHELPVLRPTAEGALEAGNVVTVEPGVYLAGRGGVRIEDLVIVTESGAEVLTPFTKDIVTLD